jgi:hypothetical protein
MGIVAQAGMQRAVTASCAQRAAGKFAGKEAEEEMRSGGLGRDGSLSLQQGCAGASVQAALAPM